MTLRTTPNLPVYPLLALTLAVCYTPRVFAQQRESYGFVPVSVQDLFRTQKRCGRGTVFHWNGVGRQSGGPDLSEPIVTDRPDFTEASSTVGFGVAQIEFGYTFVRNNDGGTLTETHSLGEPLLRFGIFDDWLEGRVAAFPANQRTLSGAMTSRSTTLDSLYVGAKVGLTPQAGALPEMALMPQAIILTGADSDADFLPGLNLLYAWELSEDVSMAGSCQVNQQVDATGQHYYDLARSVALGVSLTDRLGSYVEYFGIVPQSGAAASSEHYVDGGFTYLISNDIQWDIRIGKGLNSAADDTFFGTGLSMRFH